MNRLQRLIGAYTLLGLLAILFIVATFTDKQISQTFVNGVDKNYFGMFFEIWGLVPWTIPLMVIAAIFINWFIYTKSKRLHWSAEYLIYGMVLIIMLINYFWRINEKSTAQIVCTVLTVVSYLMIYAYIVTYYKTRKDAFVNGEYKMTTVLWMIGFMIAEFLTVTILKEIFCRSRPNAVLLGNDPFEHWYDINYSIKGKSFPSGHTATALTLLSLLFPLKKDSKAFFAMVIICWIEVFLVGFSRVTFLKHFVTDVVMSCLISFGYYFLFDWCNNKEWKVGKKVEITND